MNSIFQFVLRNGYATLFAALFAHQIGLPIPGPLLLLAAGALAATGKLGLLAVVGITITACVSADWVWYEAGRRRGDKVLHFLHRLTRDPDFHDRRAKRVFARYGLPLLLFAKFVPGLDAVAPPLAGASRTSRAQFLAFDSVGAGLYATAYAGLGYIFSHDLDRAAGYVTRAGRLLLGLGLVGICAYVANTQFWRFRRVHGSEVLHITPAHPIESEKSVGMHGIMEGQENGD